MTDSTSRDRSGHFDSLEAEPWDDVVMKTYARIPEQLRYLAAHSPYYAERISDTDYEVFAVPSAFSRIPLMDKDDERKSQEKAPPFGMHMCASEDDLVSIQASSGTTGKPTFFGITAHDRQTWDRIIARACWTAGMRPFDKVARLSTFSMFVGGLPAVSAVWSLGAAVIPIGSTAGTEATLDYIERLGATVVTCTPSYAAHLLGVIGSDGAPRVGKLRVELLILGGEPGAQIPSVRKRLAQGWNAQVRDVMGLGEIASGCWAECGFESGMHFTGQEDVLVEIIEPESLSPLPWEEGVSGELVYTAVKREATPVLRFRSHDHVEVAGVGCPCGRTSPRVRVKGRFDDMFIVRGVNVFPTAVREIVSSHGSTFSGQLLIRLSEREGQVQSPVAIDVEAGAGHGRREFDALKQLLDEDIHRRLHFRSAVRIVEKGEIPPTTHKTQYVVRERV